MSFGYVIRPRAAADLDEIGDYLAEEAGLDTGLQFLADVYAAFGLLASHREIGWPCPIRHPRLKGVRVMRVGNRFLKYLIFYKPSDDQIEILRVLHGSQDLVELFEREGVK